MNCAFPLPLSDLEIMKYVDGEADPATMSHILQCAACAARAGDVDRLQQRLRINLRRTSCPDIMVLVDFRAGFLGAEQEASLRAHLQECPTCAEDLAALDQAADDKAPPARQGRVRFARIIPSTAPGRAERLLIPQLAMRGGGGAAQAFVCDGVKISLQSQADATRPPLRRLVGKVRAAPGDFNGWTLQLWQGLTLAASTALEPNGAFAFGGLEAGRYEPRFLTGAEDALEEVVLPVIEV